jgi:hypothetical protein
MQLTRLGRLDSLRKAAPEEPQLPLNVQLMNLGPL